MKPQNDGNTGSKPSVLKVIRSQGLSSQTHHSQGCQSCSNGAGNDITEAESACNKMNVELAKLERQVVIFRYQKSIVGYHTTV